MRGNMKFSNQDKVDEPREIDFHTVCRVRQRKMAIMRRSYVCQTSLSSDGYTQCDLYAIAYVVLT